jgi:hypothetical protein
MRSSAIRLDSFVAGAGYIGAPSGTAGLEAAFQRGLEQGLNDGRELSLDALTSALAELHGGLAAHQAIAATQRREAMSELLPVLDAMVDLLGEHSARARLRDALMTELERISEIATPRRLLIRCAADMRPDVESCLKRAGFPDALIEETPDGAQAVELVADKAAITFDADAAIAALKLIIADIMTED